MSTGSVKTKSALSSARSKGSKRNKYKMVKISKSSLTKKKRGRPKKPKFQEASGTGQISYKTANYKSRTDKQKKLLTALKTIAPQRYTDLQMKCLNSNAGRQAYWFFKSNYGGTNTTYTNQDYSDIARIKSILNTYPKPTGTDNANSVKYVSLAVSEDIQITNQDNSTCQMFIFDIVTKKNVNRSPWGVWESQFNTTQSYMTPPETTYVYGGGTIPAIGAAYATVPGQLPTQQFEFNKYFKVLNKTRVIMSPGETHIHKKYSNKIRVIDCDLTDSYVSMAGISEYTLIISIGFPANDATNKLTEINYQTTKLDVIQRITHTFKPYSINKSLVYIQSLPAEGFTNNESVMNPTTATVQTASTSA